MIRSIGRVPAERTTTYKIRRAFDAVEEEPTALAQAQLRLASAEKHVTYAQGAY